MFNGIEFTAASIGKLYYNTYLNYCDSYACTCICYHLT